MSRLQAAIALVLVLSAPTPAFAACAPGSLRGFEIENARELSHLMGLQAEAERFVAGTAGEAGVSAKGRLFAGAEEFFSVVEHAGTQGAAAAGAWDLFSGVMSTSAEASMHLLPGEMQLVVTAGPVRFMEDATTTGTWSVAATATSKPWNLTEEILTAALEKAMDKASLDPVLDKAGGAMKRKVERATSKRLVELAEAVAKEKVGGDALVDFSAGQLGAFLAAIGASEGPNGFYLPAQCWQVDAGWDGWAFAEVDGTAIALSGERGYVPQAAGSATLRIWTIDGKQAFGNRMRSASVVVEVLPIVVELMPSIQKVEPGARVPFFATVHNAVDPGLEWTASAGRFVDRQPAGPASETNMLATPTDPKRFPIRVEVRSTSATGPRGRAGAPVRRARAVLQLADAVIDIQPAGGCMQPGDTRRFTADVLGAKNQSVEWTATGPAGGGIGDTGEFTATREGTHVIRATWKEDSEVSSEVHVQVTKDCDSWYSFTASGDVNEHQEGRLAGIHGVTLHRNDDGACMVRAYLLLDAARARGLSLGAALPVGLVEGSYPIGQGYTRIIEAAEDSGASLRIPLVDQRDAYLESTGTFFVGYSPGLEHSRIRDGGRLPGGGDFTSDSGSVTVRRLPGNRVELSFTANLIETTAEGKQVLVDGRHLVSHYYPLRRVAIRGHAVHTLRPLQRRKGLFDLYLCEPLE